MTAGMSVVAETALGFTGAVVTPGGVARATLFKPTRSAAIHDLGADAPPLTDTAPEALAVTGLLQAYVRGEAELDSYRVDIVDGTPFQQDVWRVLREVPRGETRTYGWVVRRLGLPAGAARAVGAAVGANRIPLWVPCHRIIGSDGKLHGFAGGLEMKQALLELEGALPRSLV